MKYEAVIFDLFGTLIHKFSMREHHNVLQQIAAVLSMKPEDLIQYWYDTLDERGFGVFQSFEANIRYICDELNISVKDNQIDEAAQIERDYNTRSVKPKPHTVEVLSILKSKNYKTGLITDCSAEIPLLWRKTEFAPLIDVAVFSCSVGLQKPDPRIYQLAVKNLKVMTEACLYVGDGDSYELSGASAVGMHPVLFRDPKEDSDDVHRVRYEAQKWNGPVVTSLKDILNFVK